MSSFRSFKKCLQVIWLCLCALLFLAIPGSGEASSIFSFLNQDNGPVIKGFQLGDSYTEMCSRTRMKWYRMRQDIPEIATLVNSNINYSNHSFYTNYDSTIVVALDSNNKVDYVEISEQALKKMFKAHNLDKAFLKAFIEAYNIPRLDMKRIVSFIVDCNVAVYNTETWAIEFNMLELNIGDIQESTIGSMQLFRIVPENYDFN